MNSKKFMLLAAAGTLMLTGCNKKLNQFQADYPPLSLPAYRPNSLLKTLR